MRPESLECLYTQQWVLVLCKTICLNRLLLPTFASKFVLNSFPNISLQLSRSSARSFQNLLTFKFTQRTNCVTTLYFVNHYCSFLYTNITGQMLSEDFSKRCRVRDVVARIMVYYYGQLFINKYVIKHFLALLGKNRMGCYLYGQFSQWWTYVNYYS